MTALGIMGGTFDPIHIGHLAAAEEAREALALDRILFVPAGDPPHKPGEAVTEAHHRVAMVALGIADNAGFELCRLEVDRPGPSYTVDTLESLAAEERAAGRQPDLTLILSAESFTGLPAWHEPRRLFELARIAVVPRAGLEAPDDAWVERHFPGVRAHVERLSAPRIGLSATEIRERVRGGRSIRYLVADAVIAYIGDHGLYRGTGGRRIA